MEETGRRRNTLSQRKGRGLRPGGAQYQEKTGTTGVGLHTELGNGRSQIWEGTVGDVLDFKSHFKSNGNKCIKGLKKMNGTHTIAL